MQCLSRLISYTVFIAFLYFLTVITHPPTTTNPCLLYPKNFIFWPLPQPIFFFSGWANSPCSSWWPRKRGSTSLTGAWSKNIQMFQQNLHDAHVYISAISSMNPLWEAKTEILLNRGKRFFVELFHGRERKVAKIIVIMTIFQSAANISKTQISFQAEELSSRVHEWMGPVHRFASWQSNLTRTWQSNSTWQELDNLTQHDKSLTI